jgi:hypothetical protein
MNAEGVRDSIPLTDGFASIVKPLTNTAYELTFQNSGELNFNGKVLAVFGCDSDKLPINEMFKPGNPNAAFVGVKDGEGTGMDAVPSNNWAAYWFVRTYMTTKGTPEVKLNAAKKAAQGVYKNSNARNNQGILIDKRDIVTSRKIE